MNIIRLIEFYKKGSTICRFKKFHKVKPREYLLLQAIFKSMCRNKKYVCNIFPNLAKTVMCKDVSSS